VPHDRERGLSRNMFRDTSACHASGLRKVRYRLRLRILTGEVIKMSLADNHEYLYRGDSLRTLRQIPPDKFYRAMLDQGGAGTTNHPGLDPIRREADALGAAHFRICFWRDLPNALARYSFGVAPSALLRIRVQDLRDRWFRFSVDEHTGEGGIVASVIDRPAPLEGSAGKFSSSGIPLESVEVLCADDTWRSLIDSGIFDDRDICQSALRFSLPLSTGTAKGCAWHFEALRVVYIRQPWNGGCYLAGSEEWAITAALEIARAFDLVDIEHYRWIYEVEGMDASRYANEAHLVRVAPTLRDRLNGKSIDYTLRFTGHRRGSRDAWLEDLGAPVITSGEWRWLTPVASAAGSLGISRL
jgi:hypothetical protein